MEKELKKLYMSAFADSERYALLFFDTLAKRAAVKTTRKNGELACAFYLMPYDLKVSGEIIKAFYFCAAATASQYRGQGLMSSLIMDTMQELKEQGTGAVYLIPAGDPLFEFYKKFGFEPAFSICSEQILPCRNHDIKLHPLKSAAVMKKYYEKVLLPGRINAIRPLYHFEFIIKEMAVVGGGCYEVFYKGKSEGYIVVQGDTVREAVCGIDHDILLPAVCAALGGKSMTATLPAYLKRSGIIRKCGMILPLNCEIPAGDENYINLLLN